MFIENKFPTNKYNIDIVVISIRIIDSTFPLYCPSTSFKSRRDVG